MKYIYLSPHFDDAALSCGGLIWDQVQQGNKVEVWNIFAGNPPPGELSLYAQVHHKVWALERDEVVPSRRKEDVAAMAILGASTRNFDFPDAIYRKHPKTGDPMYTSGEDLFGGIDPGDTVILRRLSIKLLKALPDECVLVSPLTVGNHVDHQMVRAAVDLLPVRPRFYPEYPYTNDFSSVIPDLVPREYSPQSKPISDLGLAAWQDSVAAYKSQISTFWTSIERMREGIRHHAAQFGGVTLWYPSERQA